MANARPRGELEGYLEGLRYRLRVRERDGRADRTASQAVERGARHLEAGRLDAAERELSAAEELLDLEEPERELVEYPRGLVDYVPTGDRGVPPERDEEPLANRLLLVERLLQVRRGQGANTEALLGKLHEANRAYASGDRQRARRLCDEVHGALDALGPPPGGKGEA
jgi:hypothetical protein